LLLSVLFSQISRSCSAASLFPRSMSVSPFAFLGLIALSESSKKGDVYNILWALVFGFATINILSLVSRRIDPNRQNRMSFGEMMAVGTVAVAVILLGWEMLYLFKILPLRLH
jgi:small neutral amino acid transporter SnatA (MarC family)